MPGFTRVLSDALAAHVHLHHDQVGLVGGLARPPPSAVSMSIRLLDQMYDEKPTTATLTPLTSTTVISSGAPVCSRPCSSSAVWVFS